MPASPPRPAGLPGLLARAAADPALRRALRERGAAAAAAFDLSPTERAILAAVPAAQLAALLDGLAAPPGLARRQFLREAGSAAAALGGAVLGVALAPGAARAERSPPPAGIRPELPWFTGEVDLVRYRTFKGPARAIYDEAIELGFAARAGRELPRGFSGTFALRVEVDAMGNVTKVTAGKAAPEHRAALGAMELELRRVRFPPSYGRTTLGFDAVFAPHGRSRRWSGRVELVDLDAIGPHDDALRRFVRELVPRARALLQAAGERDRPSAGKLRYTFRVDVDGTVIDPRNTKNTAVYPSIVAPLLQQLAAARFAANQGPSWCRFSLVLTPEPAP